MAILFINVLVGLDDIIREIFVQTSLVTPYLLPLTFPVFFHSSNYGFYSGLAVFVAPALGKAERIASSRVRFFRRLLRPILKSSWILPVFLEGGLN